MEAKDTLWHIDWGDGDTTFIVAPDRETAISRMPDGKDMVNTAIELNGLYNLIYRAGIREVVEWIEKRFHANSGYECAVYLVDKRDWQDKLKEWGIKED